MTSALWNLLFFALALGLLVVIHEGGHYLAAKFCKVKVYRFSIGFGPVIYRRTMKDGAEFALSLIPMGGYVKMKGENGDEEEEQGSAKGSAKDSPHEIETDFAHIVSSNAKDSFSDKTVGQRALIVAAGPISNIILAMVLYTIMNMVGVANIIPVVSEIEPGSIAYNAQLKDKDLIKEVDGSTIYGWGDFVTEVIADVGGQIELTVVEDMGKGAERKVVLDLSTLHVDPRQDVLESLGFAPLLGKYDEALSFVEKGSVADLAGIRVGDKVVAINGVPTPDWPDVVRAIKLNGEKTMLFEYQRDGVIHQAKITPIMKYNEQKQRYTPNVGIGIAVIKIDGLFTLTHYGPIDAVVKASQDTLRMSVMILEVAKKLISGALGTENIAGPISIAKGAGHSADIGFSAFLWFLATLSINLGVVNLLPIPVLDGGQLIYLAYEKITGRRPNERVQRVLTAIGLTILISLTMLAIFNDLAALQVKIVNLL